MPTGLAVGAVVFATCAANTMTIEQALAEHADAWMEIDGVEGTGIGLCRVPRTHWPFRAAVTANPAP